MFDDQTLLDYLRETLSSEKSRDVEAALREQGELRARLAELIDRHFGDEIAPGTLWKNARLSCPSREQWGSFLLGVLEPVLADYYRFHLETVQCDFCRANVEDLRELHRVSTAQRLERQQRVFRSSVGAIRISRSNSELPKD